MKPRFDHRIKRPQTYSPADETVQPGYLQGKFRAMRAAGTRQAREEAERAVKAAATVAPIKTRRVA
jgi:hypothetical protein